MAPSLKARELLKPYGVYENANIELYLRGSFYLSRPGDYGHLRQYPRQVVFVDIQELRPRRPSDCAAGKE